jgi:hypothetical protein
MNEFNQDHPLETYKSVIQVSLEGLKLMALLNGGAAVAILAYLGNITGKVPKTPNMTWPMACFLAGLFFTGLTFFISYVTQFSLYRESIQALNTEGGVASQPNKVRRLIGIIVALFSLTAFLVGSLWAVNVFKDFTTL